MNVSKTIKEMQKLCPWGMKPTSTQCLLSICKHECEKALKEQDEAK